VEAAVDIVVEAAAGIVAVAAVATAAAADTAEAGGDGVCQVPGFRRQGLREVRIPVIFLFTTSRT
jgi:hypothetical protein